MKSRFGAKKRYLLAFMGKPLHAPAVLVEP